MCEKIKIKMGFTFSRFQDTRHFKADRILKLYELSNGIHITKIFFGGGAFNIFLLRQFFRTIPEELADAARIDGCSEFGIYWRIMLPLSKPALVTVASFTFLAAWNDLIGPLVYLRTPETFTVAIGLAQFRGAMTTRWDLQMAAAALMILPVVLLFFFAQRYFIRGIVLTGLKG